MGTLHIETGCLAIVSRETPLESVYDSAAAEQVLHRRHIGAMRRRCAFTSVKIRPFRRHQRLASVGKNQNQVQSLVTLPVAKNGERLTFKWVMLPSYRDVFGKVLEMGSVSCFPSIRFRIGNYWPV